MRKLHRLPRSRAPGQKRSAMKKNLLLLALLSVTAAASAQDTIVFKDAKDVTAKVVSVNPDTVTYLKWDNQDGPTYTANKSEILFIKYHNGTKDIFSTTTSGTESTAVKKGSRSRIQGIRLQSYIYVGTVFNSVEIGPAADLNIGLRFFDYAYIGVESGFHYLVAPKSELSFREAYVPVGVNLKGYIPTGKLIYPYVNCSLGGFFGVMDLNGLNGFYCQAGIGIDIWRFSIGVGYTGLLKYGTANLGYVKIGFRFGKW